MKKNTDNGQLPRRALELRREVLQELNSDDLRRVAGGGSRTFGCVVC